RLVYWAGGNPFHHHQDINRLRRAWQRPGTNVLHEPRVAATARPAHVGVPAATPPERNELGACHRGRHLVGVPQASAAVGEARSDFTIYSALAQRLGGEEAYTQGRGEMDWLRHLYGRWREKLRTNQAAIPDFDGFWNEGFIELPRRADEYVMLAE